MRDVADVLDEASLDLGLPIEVMRSLWRLNHALAAASRRMLAEHGVTGGQRMAVRLIARFKSISPGELARLLHLDPSTLTLVVGKLTQLGLVRRETDGSDGRRAHLSLTARGAAVNELQRGTVEAAVRRALEASLPDELESARAVLLRICRELDADRAAG